MPALTAGTLAPEISAPDANGNKFSMKQALKRGPVVAAFFKISCPVCQLAFPYLERIHRTYRGSNVSIVGISQDEGNDTQDFASEYGVTFPLALDDVNRYPASNAYELTNVPTIFLVDPTGEVKLSIVGWDKRDMERLNAEVARASGVAPQSLFHRGEDIPDFKAG